MSLDKEASAELARVVELLEKATPGPWRSRDATVLLGLPTAGGFDISNCPAPTENAAAIAAAVNFLRKHGASLLSSHSEDDATLADTQRAIIEAAERRGYDRAKAEHGGGGEAVATVCLVGERYAHGNMVEVQLQLASYDAPTPKIGDRYYLAPPPQPRAEGMVLVEAYRETLRRYQDGRVFHNVHTRQVARAIQQEAEALAAARRVKGVGE